MLKIELLSAIPLLGIDPEKTIIRKHTCTPMFTAVPFTIIKTSKHFFFVFLGPHLRPIEVPGLGVESELKPLAYDATATATPDWSHTCELYHSPGQHQLLNPLIEVRDRTRILMDTRQIRFHCATKGTSFLFSI